MKKDGKIVETLSVETVRAAGGIELKIVMTVDNSFSMGERNAVRPLLVRIKQIYGLHQAVGSCPFDGSG